MLFKKLLFIIRPTDHRNPGLQAWIKKKKAKKKQQQQQQQQKTTPHAQTTCTMIFSAWLH